MRFIVGRRRVFAGAHLRKKGEESNVLRLEAFWFCVNILATQSLICGSTSLSVAGRSAFVLTSRAIKDALKK